MGQGSTGMGQDGDRWAGRAATRLVLQEEDDPTGGHKAQLLLKALGGADLTLHADAGEAGAVQVGAVREPRVPSGLGAAGQRVWGQPTGLSRKEGSGPGPHLPGAGLVHRCIQLEGPLKVVETDHVLVERAHLNAAPVAREAEGLGGLRA